MHYAPGLIPELKVMGTNFRTRDGTAIRDFVHVTDLVDAHIAVVGRNPRTRDPLTLRP